MSTPNSSANFGSSPTIIFASKPVRCKPPPLPVPAIGSASRGFARPHLGGFPEASNILTTSLTQLVIRYSISATRSSKMFSSPSKYFVSLLFSMCSRAGVPIRILHKIGSPFSVTASGRPFKRPTVNVFNSSFGVLLSSPINVGSR